MQNAIGKDPLSMTDGGTPSDGAGRVLQAASALNSAQSKRPAVKAKIIAGKKRSKSDSIQADPPAGASAWWNF